MALCTVSCPASSSGCRRFYLPGDAYDLIARPTTIVSPSPGQRDCAARPARGGAGGQEKRADGVARAPRPPRLCAHRNDSIEDVTRDGAEPLRPSRSRLLRPRRSAPNTRGPHTSAGIKKTDTRASRTVRGAIRSRGRIAECPRLQQNDSRTTRRSTARSPDRQRIRLPPTVRAGAQGFFACAALPSGRCQHQGAVSPAPADVTLCCTTCNARNEVSSHVCQLPIDANQRDN